MNNSETPDSLNIAFPNTVLIVRPYIKVRKIKSLQWLAGFTYAEGYFFVALKKPPGSKLGETV